MNLLDLLLLVAGVEHDPFHHTCFFVNEQLCLRFLTSMNVLTILETLVTLVDSL